MAKNDDWLALTPEETLEPALPICDPHHHLWDARSARLTPRYLLEEVLRDLTSGHNVVSTVFIECGAMYRQDGEDAMKFVGEVEFANGIAAMSASGLYGKPRVAAGIVGTANLLGGSATGRVLDALIAAGNGRFKGIRHGGSWDASDAVNNPRPNPTTPPMAGLFNMPAFREGFAELAPRGLSFEGWCFHPQIPELTDLARAFPETAIIFNHFGAPLGIGPYSGKRDAIFPVWQQYVAELATCPNVYAKLGGINMPLNGYGWHERPSPPTSQELADTTRPYYDFTVEQFGPDRCMFESNFPVDLITCSYNTLWNTFKRLSTGYSADEKSALFHDTATRVYRLSN